jgi:UDP-N-acetyl-D-glucosamine dehydrogenase
MRLKSITKLIAGHTKSCANKVNFLYKKIFDNVYLCKTIEIAETAKLFENIFRAVNISLVNEMKMITNKLNINIHDVVEAAASKPFGFKKFAPGPGVGGHCIPIDPVFMTWLAKKNNYKTRFINLSTKVNKEVTEWIIKGILKNLPNKRKTKILILGLAYKKNVNDLRESPSLKIFKKLILKKNIEIDISDPYVKYIMVKNKSYKTINVKNYKIYDCVILLTDHSKFNYRKILKESKLIIDTRGIYKNKTMKKVISL